METGLDVEAAREAVLDRLRQLEANLSAAAQQDQDQVSDLDFVFKLVYNCTSLRDQVAQLERGVANLTHLANENPQPAPGDGGQWASPVKELQLGLQQVTPAL